MSRRQQSAIERAGRLDRAHNQLEHAKEAATDAYRILNEEDPETAAIVARVIMANEAALKRLATL